MEKFLAVIHQYIGKDDILNMILRGKYLFIKIFLMILLIIINMAFFYFIFKFII